MSGTGEEAQPLPPDAVKKLEGFPTVDKTVLLDQFSTDELLQLYNYFKVPISKIDILANSCVSYLNLKNYGIPQTTEETPQEPAQKQFTLHTSNGTISTTFTQQIQIDQTVSIPPAVTVSHPNHAGPGFIVPIENTIPQQHSAETTSIPASPTPISKSSNDQNSFRQDQSHEPQSPPQTHLFQEDLRNQTEYIVERLRIMADRVTNLQYKVRSASARLDAIDSIGYF